MLRRLGHGCWSNASTLGLLRCRRSTVVGVRFVSDHLVPGSSGDDMDPAASASPAATNARWAMLSYLVLPRDESIVADAKTVADCRTTAFGGGQLRLSMVPAPPPESSFLYYDWTGSAELAPGQEFRVMAAHGDSVLLDAHNTGACFVYRAGAATRPPSLSQLLPARDVPSDRRVRDDNTGLLRRSEDEFLVAQLEVTTATAPIMFADTFLAEVWVLHAGRREWELKPATPIVILDDDEGDGADKRDRLRQCCWHDYFGCKVVPVGDRFLCWADVSRGFVLVCDMAEEHSRLRYVPLPMLPAQPTDPYSHDYARRPEIEQRRDLCGVSGGVMKLVSIEPRCYCCAKSSNAFLVTTWTLVPRAGDDDGPMAWVKDDVELDCEELWALPGYDGLPRVQPTCPVVSLDNPDVVCFKVSEIRFKSWEERKVWKVTVDMRKKALLSVGRLDPQFIYYDYNLSVKLQC